MKSPDFCAKGKACWQQEPATIAWFGIRLGPTTFAIFDAFADDARRHAHLSGKVAKALPEKAPELLAEPPKIEKADVLADRRSPIPIPTIWVSFYATKTAWIRRRLVF